MTVPDVNLLVYAYNPNAPEHARARRWLETEFRDGGSVGLTWAVLWAFLRIQTNRRLPHAIAPNSGFRTVRTLLRQPNAYLLSPGERHLEILEELVIQGQTFGPDVSDAVLAAIAIEHGATLASTDRDFARFRGLRWVNPLDS